MLKPWTASFTLLMCKFESNKRPHSSNIASRYNTGAVDLEGIASKVIDLVRFGFAAGCEAAALPRRRGAFYISGYALGLAYGPNGLKRAQPKPGA
jgi:hypothetical protein